MDSTSSAVSKSVPRQPENDPLGNSEAPATAASVGRRHRRRSHGHRSSESRLRLLKLALGVGGAIFFLIVLFMSGYMASIASENDVLVAELNRSERALARLEAEFEQVRSQRDLLVENRIPNLRPLAYDEAIPLDQDYVRNVIFTLARNGDEARHEYRVVLHNDSLAVIHPEVKIVLFNEVGVQIGTASVDNAEVSTETDRTLLDPGEVRSYSGTIAMLGSEPPRYFLIAVE